MQQYNWAKTLLKSYNYLDRLVGGIDKSFKKISYSSFYYNSANCASTLNVSKKLIDLNERKVLLINTKVLVDTLLSRMGEEGAKYLTLRYIDNLKNEDIAALCACCVRTVSRKMSFYLEKISDMLNKWGFNDKKLNNLYKDEQWVMDIFFGDYEG